MLTIRKFQLGPDYKFEMPIHAKVLTVQTEKGNPMLYALVDTSRPVQTRQFAICPEDGVIEEPMGSLNYVASFQIPDGTMTFHVFEVNK